MKQAESVYPLVSIITPLYNGVKYLELCIRSVLGQTYSKVEHVIVDGGSTDGTLEVLERYQKEYPDRIRFVSEPDKGACDAWNKGWRMARGDIFGWLGADDCYEPDAVRNVIDYMTENPHAFFVYGECDIIDEYGNVSGRYATKDFTVETAVNFGECISSTSAFYRREVVESAGCMMTDINACDHDFYIRVGKKYPLYRISHTLSQYRIHQGGVTGSIGDDIYPKEFYRINRLHRGDRLSPVCRRYYMHVLKRIPVVGTLFDNKTRVKYSASKAAGIRNVAIFGAAIAGKQCYEQLSVSGYNVRFYLDNFPPSEGKYLNLSVQKPDYVIKEGFGAIDAVVIASGGRSAEMKAQLKAMKFKKPIFENWNELIQ
ncbi:MAG TPA: glycosyltransferase family 2 protein [Paenibacillus sp.]|uniref:glycosyltransferase family 2 protein n=1 Tax=Paenibacillus sp. TaxID=58172 RepID=UPI002BC1C0AC|nr:glycosyltransferase family 2 protein [Paenibacillus sp.]HUC92013.1 glycosyltransferase family 2 protein [Paenibacillus sp.]